MNLGLDGKRVLITAGAAGIGRVIARAFATEGAKVLVCDVDAKALADFARENQAVRTMIADVSDEASVDSLFTEAQSALGGLDVLVNNAGIAGPTGPVETLGLDDWNRTLTVNITGQFLCARRAAVRS